MDEIYEKLLTGEAIEAIEPDNNEYATVTFTDGTTLSVTLSSILSDWVGHISDRI